MNPVAIESHLGLVLVGWIAIILVARLAGWAAERVGQPRAVGEIIGGLLLGPSFLGALWPEGLQFLFPPESQQTLQVLAKVGLIFLMFHVGMEFEHGKLWRAPRTVLAVSLAGIVVPMLLGLLIGPWLHQEFAPDTGKLGFQLYLSITLAISALPIMGRILLEMDLVKRPFAVIAINAAAFDDVVGWVGLAAVTALVTTGFTWSAVALQVGGLVVLIGALGWLAVPLAARVWSRRPQVTEALPGGALSVILALLLVSCLVTNVLGLFSIFGAFLFGAMLHRERSLVSSWRTALSSFVGVALVPIFFTNTGLRTQVGSLDTLVEWGGLAVIMLAAVGGKLGGCYAAARLTGVAPREAGCIGALMNARALMGLVAINVGADLGYVPRELFTMLILMALATTIMTAPLLRALMPPLHSAPDDPAPESPPVTSP